MALLLPCRKASMLPSCRSSYAPTRLSIIASLLRVPNSCDRITSHYASKANITQYRSLSTTATRYATTTGSKPVSRPKAHTGKAPAKKKTATAKPTSTKKATSSTAGGRKKPTKTAKTTSKAKSKPKVKPKAVKKKKGPTASDILKQGVAKRKEIKVKALLDEPKKLPDNAWMVLFHEKPTSTGGLAGTSQHIKELGMQYRNMSADERERLNHTANQNKARNEEAYKKWVSQFTPLQIKEANNARRQIASAKPPTKNSNKKRAVHLIKDTRLVKRPANSYSRFVKARYESGDMKGMRVSECGKLIAREWRELSASEKKQYENESAADVNRYKEEHKTVYGTEAFATKAASAA